VAEPTSSQLKISPIRIIEVDPKGADALALLHEAANEARKLYPEHFAVDAPWPVNPPTPERGVYLLGYQELEVRAAGFGYTVMRLETGNRQLSVMALYETLGFKRIAPFGAYVNDPLSICFEKTIRP
jgi:hypothetical protein